jgi:hypothetical protein
MIKSIICSVIFLYSSLGVFARDMVIQVQIGQSQYDMSDMHLLQQNIVSEYGSLSIPAEITSEFPSFYYTRVDIIKKFNPRYAGGFTWTHMEAGGRVHYADYSGHIVSDQIVRSNGYGWYNAWTIRDFNSSNFMVNMPVYGLWSSLSLSDEMKVFDESENTEYELVALGLALAPSLAFQYKITRLSLTFEGGYQLSYSKAFHLKDEEDAILRVDGNKLGPNWSGLRIGIAVGYQLF